MKSHHWRVLFAVLFLISGSAHAGGLPAGGSAPAQAPKPPISASTGAQKMPAHVHHFNHAGHHLASNGYLMDAQARLAFQQQANALAASYRGLQQDAQSGNYNTSQMQQMMQGFGNNVEGFKLPEVNEPKEADDAAARSLGGASASAQVDQRSATIILNTASPATAQPAPENQAAELAVAPAAPVDPALAAANEQIVPDLSAAVAKDDAPARAASNLATQSGTTPADTLANGVVLRSLASAGDAKDSDFRYQAPDVSGDARRHESGETTVYLGGSGSADSGSAPTTSPTEAKPLAAAPLVHSLEEDEADEESGRIDKRNAKPKAKPKPSLPGGLAGAVARVQGGATKEKGGFFSEMKQAVFGPRMSTFFQPLTFPKERPQPGDASLGDDSPDLWWQALALPLLFTIVFSGIVWFHYLRQNRELLQSRSTARDEEEDAEPQTSVVRIRTIR